MAATFQADPNACMIECTPEERAHQAPPAQDFATEDQTSGFVPLITGDTTVFVPDTNPAQMPSLFDGLQTGEPDLDDLFAPGPSFPTSSGISP